MGAFLLLTEGEKLGVCVLRWRLRSPLKAKNWVSAFSLPPASCTSYFVLMMATLNALVILGLIRSF